MKGILFYTVGLPGAGKTTLAKHLSFLLDSEHLRGDKIGLELFHFPTFSPEERRMVYAEMDRRATQALRAGKHVIYDAVTNSYAQRAHLEKIAHQHGGHAVGLWVQVPLEKAKKRAGTVRDAGVVGGVARVIPPHIFDQYVTNFEKPTVGEPVIRVSGEAPFFLQYRRVLRQIPSQRASLIRLIQS